MKAPGEDFVEPARRFCEFIECAKKLPLRERMRTAHRLLLQLYAAGLELPHVETSDDSDPPDVAPLWIGFEHLDFYWEVFDPYEEAPALTNAISDDLGDIYLDVRRGLALWDAEKRAAAVWAWQFHFDIHWGNHAADALRALHWARSRV